MSRRRRTDVNDFVDLVAQVDNEEEEEDDEGEDEFDQFIDNTTLAMSEGIRRWQDYRRNPETSDTNNDDDDFFKELEEHAHERARAARTTEKTMDRVVNNTYVLPMDILLTPVATDHPIWRIECWPGFEEDAVYSLYQQAMKELLPGVYSAAYTCAPDCGAIFVEGQMNPQLNRYLTLVPGLKTRHRQPIVTFVPPEDRPRTLQIPSTRGPRLCIGQWIHISRGTYKNDIGCIKELNDSGRACVLVIPRLRPPSYSSKAGKRSRLASTPLPEPTLFDPVVIQNIFGIVPTPVNSNTFLFGGQTFEYGLLAKEINTTSISSTATTIHCQAAALFLRSKHPFIMAARFPSPAEWNFITNDLVEIDRGSSVGKLGRIRVVQPDSLEIELTDTKERILCSWYDVRKWILKGEFVKVAGGTDIGRTGFVTETNPTEICVLEGGGDGSQAVQTFTVHKNCVVSIDPPKLHPIPMPSTESLALSMQLGSRNSIPWKGVQVIVTKLWHHRKGDLAVVTNVLCNQDTPSGLKVEVLFSKYNPSGPVPISLFDYDDVVEYSTKKPLADFRLPQDIQFRPRQRSVVPPSWTNSTDIAPFDPLNRPANNRTPMPDPSEISSSTPAWNPSSQTPGWNTRATTPPSACPPHILFDARLFGVKVQAKVEGGPGNMTFASVFVWAELVENQPSIRYSANRKIQTLNSNWVTVLHPNIKQTRGLLIVIKGEHAGKFGLRICHSRHNSQDTALVALINRNKGSPPTLTGVEKHFLSEELAIVEESKEEKKWNSECIGPRRKIAQGKLV